ncbi:MAG: hypothetical protein R3E79_53855 [Caldilineaceae bacterium]
MRQGDQYTPIEVGDFAYIRRVRCMARSTPRPANRFSLAFKRRPTVRSTGERDPSNTGVVPKPPPGHVSKVRIDQLTSGETTSVAGGKCWLPAAPSTGTKEMQLTYYELEPGGEVTAPASAGKLSGLCGRERRHWRPVGRGLPFPRGVAFVPPGEAQTVTNGGAEPVRLIRCEASI